MTIGMNNGLMRPLSAGFFTPRNSRAPSSAVSSPPKPVPDHDADTRGIDITERGVGERRVARAERELRHTVGALALPCS